MGSETHHLDRYHAHKKWKKYHGIIGGLSVMTFIGILWAWLFFIRAWQHHREAKKSKQNAQEVANGDIRI